MSNNSLTENQKSLIEQVQQASTLADRYSHLECINASEGYRKGVISLVFKAHDDLEGVDVAVKFMDPERLGDRYRLEAFEREPEILSKISANKRCLTLIDKCQNFEWQLDLGAGDANRSLNLQYFVTEWLDDDVESFFERQHEISAKEKLLVYREILLAIHAIHSADIAHRDLKPDNFRAYITEKNRVVVAIDFGTSAHVETRSLNGDYHLPVGAPAYSPPEALVGFAGDRLVGGAADMYSLGAMLYELFNRELFAKAIVRTPNLESILLLLQVKLESAKNHSERLHIWDAEMKPFRHALLPPEIDRAGHSIPPSIIVSLRRLHRDMTMFDFRDRTCDFHVLIKNVDSMIRNLENQRLSALVLQRKRERRTKRAEKINARQERLNRYLAQSRLKPC